MDKFHPLNFGGAGNTDSIKMLPSKLDALAALARAEAEAARHAGGRRAGDAAAAVGLARVAVHPDDVANARLAEPLRDLGPVQQLRHAPFILWVHDLAAPERLDVMGYGIPVLTLLLGASMFLQQRMSPQQGDPTQQRVMMFMPLLFTFMFIGFPAGLTLYWLTNNVLTIAQQYFVLRSAPPATAS
jgi:hypothetical protein